MLLQLGNLADFLSSGGLDATVKDNITMSLVASTTEVIQSAYWKRVLPIPDDGLLSPLMPCLTPVTKLLSVIRVPTWGRPSALRGQISCRSYRLALRPLDTIGSSLFVRDRLSLYGNSGDSNDSL
ncbi:unnamed protein product [Nezara viridula]|uniref:Uncharacterized protein n=1 Tax=Nezara viridula TaxID=85310 RepID=A0A9P0GZJ2_NEZVI|nr:unnamed protein product [Nezara viridula]